MIKKGQTIHIVGAGLAGSECAYQLAERGYDVVVFEMRPQTMTPAHKTAKSAELVCSNSFGSYALTSASGQLKWEAEQLGSLILKSAWESRVPAGQALGMDRELFSQIVHDTLLKHPRIELSSKCVESIDEVPRPCVIATGPLTGESLARSLLSHFGDEFLYFYDAIAPIILADSIDMTQAWKASRWDKGTSDYINCPLNKEQYDDLIRDIAAAEKVEPKEFEKDTPFFEGCMPIEEMVRRGPETLRYGPMKPTGLDDPRTGRWAHAVVQLRQDNREGTAYNMVGFQTKMKYPEQKRIFKKIPALANAEFLKLGSIHRNMYVNSPQKLKRNLSSRNDDQLFLAGQITGVEGYFESTCTGLLVAHFLDQQLQGREFNPPPRASAMGSLLEAITDSERTHFQPTNINFGLFPAVTQRMKKDQKKTFTLNKAKTSFKKWIVTEPVFTSVSAQIENMDLNSDQRPVEAVTVP